MATKQEKKEASDFLMNQLKPNATVYTIVRSVSRSGMSRHIDCLVIVDGQPRYLTSAMARLGIAGMRMSERDWKESKGASIPGCGMDMCWHAVHSLGAHFGIPLNQVRL